MTQLLVNKWGINTDTDASTGAEDIIGEGGLQYWAAVEDFLDISSDSADDTLLGTGARTLYVDGVDGNYRRVHEAIPLNGLTVVNSKFKYLRVNRAFVITVGSNGVNVGNISISDGIGSMAYMAIDDAQTAKAAYTIPSNIRNPRVVLLTGQISEKVSAHVLCNLMVRSIGEGWRVRYKMSFDTDAPFSLGSGDLEGGLHLKPKDDIRVHAYDASADNLAVVAGFTIVY